MQTLKTIFRWLFTLNFTVWAAAMFVEAAYLSGIILFFVALFICPITHNFIFGKLGINLNRGYRYIVPFVLLVVSIVVLPEKMLIKIAAENKAKAKKDSLAQAKLDSMDKIKTALKVDDKEDIEEQKRRTEAKEILDATENPGKYLLIDLKGWYIDGFGSVAILNFNVKNVSRISFKDIKISITYYAESGTELGSKNEIIYKIVKAGKTLKVREFNAGFLPAQVSSCRVDVVTANIAY